VAFEIESGREVCGDALQSAHGVVWDGERELLWAIGNVELRAYALRDWRGPAPRLERAATCKLPEDNGHDLSALPGTPHLILSTESRCWLFDRERRRLEPHPTLANQGRVKCVSVHPRTRRTAWVQAVPDEWWTDTVRFLDPEGRLQLANERLYKARWNAM
jgi:hypothetical protein